MKSAGWKIFHVPTAFIYHIQGQSIGRDIRSRIEFYRSRYQFFRKWKSRPYYILVCIVIMHRLCFNWLLTAMANIFLLCMNRELRDKFFIYSKLILWHMHITFLPKVFTIDLFQRLSFAKPAFFLDNAFILN
jgi:GT2 family glycosyltransferase